MGFCAKNEAIARLIADGCVVCLAVSGKQKMPLLGVRVNKRIQRRVAGNRSPLVIVEPGSL